ncbi:MAG: hypothetical protein HY816_01015 [Candidatus Wallbacteria bacterium]|nr:hypothetical protein [Candidatus Wallbacteria bacterium]
MRVRSLLNRLLFVATPGLGQILEGRWLIGGLVGAAAAGTLAAAELGNSRYRSLQLEYRKLNLPAPLHAALAADRQGSLAKLAGLYLGLGLISAALYRENPADSDPPQSEDA